jgi:hypothetical protein
MFKDKAAELMQGAKDQVSELTGAELAVDGVIDGAAEQADQIAPRCRTPVPLEPAGQRPDHSVRAVQDHGNAGRRQALMVKYLYNRRVVYLL